MTTKINTKTKNQHFSRLNHLLSSAHVLAVTSPAAAAHLLHIYHSIAWERQLSVQAPPHNADDVVFGGGGNWCKRCGTVWILGWNCSVGGVTGPGGGARRREGEGGGGGPIRVVKHVGVRKRKQKRGDRMRKDDRARSVNSRNGNAEGHHQKIVEWVCGGCGYVAKEEVSGGGRGGNGALNGKGKRVEKVVAAGAAGQAESTSRPPQDAQRTPLAPEVVSRGQGKGRGQGSEGGCIDPMLSTSAVGAGASLRGGLPTEGCQSANQRAKERRKKKNWSLLGILAAERERERERQKDKGTGHGLGGLDLMDLMKLA